MKLKYYGHACFSLRYQDGTLLVTDPFDATVPYPPCDERCTAALVTHDHFDHNCVASLPGEFKTINTAGTYQIGGVTVRTAECFHDDQRGALRGSNLIFRIEGDGLSIAHLGDLGCIPDHNVLGALQNVDVMLLPVGGHYTIDGETAAEIVRLTRPRTVIPMHYKVPGLTVDVAGAEDFLKRMEGVEMIDGYELEINPMTPKVACFAKCMSSAN